MNLALLPGHSDRFVLALINSGTPAEAEAARAEMCKRALDFTPEQKKANRKPRPFQQTEGSFGWGGRA